MTKKVSVIGLGYIGLPTAAIIAQNGHQVIGVDIDKRVIDTVNSGKAHIVEKNLDQIIKDCIEEDENKNISDNKIKEFVETLIKKYDDEKFSFEIIKLANGYQFLTKSKYSNITKLLLKQHSDKRLSIASLETLFPTAILSIYVSGE